jgi:hypothetical protein
MAKLADAMQQFFYRLTGLKSQIPIPKTQSAFHPHAQRTASRRRGARQQSRSFARWNQRLRHSPNPTGVAEIVSDLDEEY